MGTINNNTKETKILHFIDIFMKQRYGNLEMITDPEHQSDLRYKFFKSDKYIDDFNLHPFERNSWGRLWVNDPDFEIMLKTLIPVSDEYILMYFRNKFNTYFKDIERN